MRLNIFEKWRHNRISLDVTKWMLILNIIIILVMGILHSLEAGHYANFVPINGTFQDFNPVRRFLAGQIPYKDFQDYLGLGHLYLGAIFTKILGGTYRVSLIAFRFVAFLSTALIFFTVFFVIFKEPVSAGLCTNIFLAFCLIQPTFFNQLIGNENIINALNYAMTTGNSARMLRGAILPLSALIICCMGKYAVAFFNKKERKIGLDFYLCVCAGILAGICFSWSNDYGISTWLCILLMVFWVSFSKGRKLIKAVIGFAISVVTSVLSCFIVVEIVTVGNFPNWVKATFGTGGYQAWYYNGSKSYYITDVDLSFIMCIQLFIALYYLWKVWITRAQLDCVKRYGVLAYMNITSFCAVNEYKLLSGGNSREVALIVLFATIIGELINLIRKSNKMNIVGRVVIPATLMLCFSWMLSDIQTEFNFLMYSENTGVYVEQMGGRLTSLGEDILQTADFLGDAKTFATYSSAQELVSGNFQPSGTDYLIHVLGDEARENYLESFENDDFDYAVTINETYSDWEFWLRRANWFFYESLYENWHPVYANSYEIYWARNSDNADNIYEDNINVRLEQVNDSKSIKIIVETDENVSGTADVYVDYESIKDDGLAQLLIFNNMVTVSSADNTFASENWYDSNYLRGSSKEYIPVAVVNGYGEVTMTVEPEKSMLLTVNKATCSKIYTVQFDYIQIDEISTYNGEVVFHAVDNSRNQKILESISYIYVNGEKVQISSIDEGNIVVENHSGMDISNETLKSNNVFKVE